MQIYFSSSWNYIDCGFCVLFWAGIGLRFGAFDGHQREILNSARFFFFNLTRIRLSKVNYLVNFIFLSLTFRIVLAVSLLFSYIRLIHVSIVFKSLGPKLIMIQEMVKFKHFSGEYFRFFAWSLFKT